MYLSMWNLYSGANKGHFKDSNSIMPSRRAWVTMKTVIGLEVESHEMHRFHATTTQQRRALGRHLHEPLHTCHQWDMRPRNAPARSREGLEMRLDRTCTIMRLMRVLLHTGALQFRWTKDQTCVSFCLQARSQSLLELSSLLLSTLAVFRPMLHAVALSVALHHADDTCEPLDAFFKVFLGLPRET